MSHDLTIREDGSVEFFSAVTRGWHNLGQLSPEKLSSEGAIEQAMIGWQVEAVPCEHTVENEDGSVSRVESPEHRIIRRADTKQVLSVQSPSYTIIQQQEAFAFADDLSGGGAVWDTAGSLNGGKIVFMQMELPGKLFLKSRPNDETIKRVLFFNSHDGSKAFTGMITPIRVVCQNTLNAALGNHSNQFKIKHTRNWKNRQEEAKRILGFASAYFDDLQVVMDKLAEEKVTQSYIEGFVTALFPSSKAEVSTRTENRRQDVVDLINAGRGNTGETKWDVYNGVTEWVDYRSGGRITKSRLSQNQGLTMEEVERDARFERTLLGAGATVKQRALDLLLN